MAETDLEALRDQAGRGDADAPDQLIELASEQGNLDELRRRSDQGNTTATDQLIESPSVALAPPAALFSRRGCGGRRPRPRCGPTG